MIIIGGDLNLVLNPNLDSTAENTRRACRDLGMIDVWRTFHPRTNDIIDWAITSYVIKIN